MSQLASVALDAARTLLNDDGVQLWTDLVLQTKLAVAHRELQVQLRANACPITRKTVLATVLIGAITMPNPDDMIEPVTLWEKGIGDVEADFIRMTESDPLPFTGGKDRLIHWRWTEEQFEFLGASTDREVKLLYKRSLIIPVTGTDPIGIIDGESFLGPRIAALAFGSTGNPQAADWCTNMAIQSIGDILNANRGRSRQVPRA